MARYKTHEEARDAIAALAAKETVYKVEVDEAREAATRAFETAIRPVRDIHFSKYRNELPVSDGDKELEYAMPMEWRHFYGKKFSAALEAAPETDFSDAVKTLRNRWRPEFKALEALKARQVKGRKPAPPKEVIGTRTQLRAICPCCFRQQAVRGVRMVAHGYTLDYGYQNGNCSGVNVAHFGTVEGRDWAKDAAMHCRRRATAMRATAEEVRAGTSDEPVRHGKTSKVIEDPTQKQRNIYAETLESSSRNLDYYAEMVEKALAAWKETDPVEVEVEITA
ncbi:hypothetical protein RPALISO_162 [Ruegeria phage RpAliso]|nr:hypothetical protein RPALISO_162 [Ruegeria phage RpAliso]